MLARRVGVAIALALAFVGVAGCASPQAVHTTSSRLGFTGPWAQQFETAYASAETDFERDVLRDGVVTASEHEQSLAHVASCLADSGYTITYDEDGGFELGAASGSYPDDFFEKSDPVLQRCEARWEGSIRFLYEQVRRNPDQQDEATITVRCLRSAGVVDASYSAKRWDRENATGEWSFTETSDEAKRCRLDPLGLWYH